jgi:endonuclease YncB( thermonuclease family)
LDYDKYGRAVALVYVDGKSANRIMVQAGYAWQYRKYCKESFCDDWLADEKQARKLRRGLWQDNSYEAPWIWRKR